VAARRSALVAPLLAVMMLLSGGAALGKGYIRNAELLDQIKPGTTTSKDVEKLLGAPANVEHFPKRNQSSMDYVIKDWDEWVDISVIIGDDGIVREVMRLRRFRGGP
jgi:hypothetical protein